MVHGAAAAVRGTTIIGSTSRSAEGGGGAVFNDGNMMISDSTFVGNRAIGKEGKGGGLLNGGVLTLDKSKFFENTAASYGGGLGNYRGAAEVHRSTFADNKAAQGGASPASRRAARSRTSG